MIGISKLRDVACVWILFAAAVTIILLAAVFVATSIDVNTSSAEPPLFDTVNGLDTDRRTVSCIREISTNQLFDCEVGR